MGQVLVLPLLVGILAGSQPPGALGSLFVPSKARLCFSGFLILPESVPLAKNSDTLLSSSATLRNRRKGLRSLFPG